MKAHGHDRARIEEKLGYSSNGIDQSLSRKTSGGKLYKQLLLYKEWMLNNSTSAGPGKSQGDIDRTQISILVAQQNKLIEVLNTQAGTANEILRRIADNVEVKVENISANLTDVLGRVDSLKLDVVSGRTVVLQSLARLEKKKPNALIEEGDNIIAGLMQSPRQTRGRTAGKNR